MPTRQTTILYHSPGSPKYDPAGGRFGRIRSVCRLRWVVITYSQISGQVCKARPANNDLGRQAERKWTIGNHDMRFDRALAINAPQYDGVLERLSDIFPEWDMAWSMRVNNTVMIKHRQANGVHAAYNNTLKGGLSMVTGHLHRLAVTPWADYNGRRWGVDTGTRADPLGPQFEYLENNATPWTSGFAVLTFADGLLMPPEMCQVIDDGVAWFRGSRIEV